MSGRPPRLDTVRLAAARLRASEVQPFLSLALYALTPHCAPDLGTFAVDERWRLYVDPVVLERWSVEEIAGVLLHETGHVVRDHAGRARVVGVDHATKDRWNIAGDAEINDALRDDRIALPDNGVFPEMFGLPRGKAAELYFVRLGKVDNLPSLDCGSGCHSIEDEPLPVVGERAAGLQPSEALLLRRRVAEAVRAAARPLAPGKDPGGWLRWAEAILHPTIDWRRLLSATLRGSIAAIRGATDYSYARPSRRRVPGIVLPALQRPLPTVAIVVDTSASVDDAQLSAAWTEVHGCLRSLGVRRDLLQVYAVDTAVERVQTIGAARAGLSGGGGTNMARGIEVALEARPRPQLVVVLTDGFTPWPARAPKARVVVGLLEGRRNQRFKPQDPPPWTTTIPIPREEASATAFAVRCAR